MSLQADVLIIGCGIAGAAAALRLAEDREREIVLVTRAQAAEESNSRYAQGGIIGRGHDDSAELLAQDILAAGGGISNRDAVRILSEEGPPLLHQMLIDSGLVHFDQEDDGGLSYTREGGHSARRILHVGDRTGEAMTTAIMRRLRELPNVRLMTGMTAVDLITSSHHDLRPLARYEPITCYGAYVLDVEAQRVTRIFARATILATGGLGQIYRFSTNPEGAQGSGLAMAHRAGAHVINCEFVQFHPTTLASTGADNFLISEAVRGEGGRLSTPDGEPFMERYAPQWGDLAPRDVVARAIHTEMVRNGYPYVLLDLASNMAPQRIRERFPTIYATCLRAGVDITNEPIPVVPAAHYFCGGVQVDEWSRTSVSRLYAVGEVSCTGLHGANRLASTSLLEGLLWGHRAGEDIAARKDIAFCDASSVPPWQAVQGDPPDPVLIFHDMRTIQNTMWYYVGLSRNHHRLARAMRDLNHLSDMIDGFYRTSQLNDSLVGLRNMVQAAHIVAHAAFRNRGSMGTHFREDGRQDTAASFFNSEGALPEVRAEF